MTALRFSWLRGGRLVDMKVEIVRAPAGSLYTVMSFYLFGAFCLLELAICRFVFYRKAVFAFHF